MRCISVARLAAPLGVADLSAHSSLTLRDDSTGIAAATRDFRTRSLSLVAVRQQDGLQNEQGIAHLSVHPRWRLLQRQGSDRIRARLRNLSGATEDMRPRVAHPIELLLSPLPGERFLRNRTERRGTGQDRYTFSTLARTDGSHGVADLPSSRKAGIRGERLCLI